MAESGISMVVKATDNSAMPAAQSLRQIRSRWRGLSRRAAGGPFSSTPSVSVSGTTKGHSGIRRSLANRAPSSDSFRRAPHRFPRRPLHRMPRRPLPRGAARARRRVLHPGRVERRPPPALVVARELKVEALARHADHDAPDVSPGVEPDPQRPRGGRTTPRSLYIVIYRREPALDRQFCLLSARINKGAPNQHNDGFSPRLDYGLERDLKVTGTQYVRLPPSAT
jgi:hypothetical protein